MQRVKIVLEGKDAGGNPFFRSNILPSTAIEATQKLYGQSIKKIVPVDDNGNEINAKVQVSQSRNAVARTAMEKLLTEKGIKFKDSMTDDELLKLIQKSNTTPAIKTSTKKSFEDLKVEAKELGIKGYQRMKEDTLLNAIDNFKPSVKAETK